MGTQEQHEEREPQPPGFLLVVQRFVNTLDVEPRKDELADASRLRDWLLAQGLIEQDAAVTDEDLRRAVEVRESLRALLLANHDGEAPSSDAVETLNRVASESRLTVSADSDGRLGLRPAETGVLGALGRILAAVYEASVAGTWQRLKVCREGTCLWAFYDVSKNRSRTWCSMAVCGNRTKARQHRARRRSSAGG